MEPCGHRTAQSFAILSGLCQASSRSLPEYLPFEFGEDCQQASHRAAGWGSQIQSLGQRNETRRQDIGVPAMSQADPLRNGPSDPAATPAPHRCRAGERPPAVSRELPASPRRSQPHALASQWPSRGEPHILEGRDSAWEASADRSWTRGRRGQPETFSVSCVTGQKRLWIFGLREARLTAISDYPMRLAAEDPFRPYAGPSYYAAVGVVDRARVSR